MTERFYLPLGEATYRDNPQRAILPEDFGSLFKIAGLVMQGMGSTAILLLPSALPIGHSIVRETYIHQPALEVWGDIIRRTDNPEIWVAEGEEGTLRKVLQRKSRHEVSGLVQQQIWRRDQYRCMYCRREMGDVQLTIDHFMPLELGGVNDPSNYLSCCRKCNRRKGNLPPTEFCRQQGVDYGTLEDYLKMVSEKA